MKTMLMYEEFVQKCVGLESKTCQRQKDPWMENGVLVISGSAPAVS